VSAALLAGCSVVPLPTSTALRGQGDRERDWDVQDCQAEAGYQTHYSPGDSPLANFFQKVFFWGGVGASVGGLITGFPVSIAAGPATDGLIAGAGAGGIAGSVESLSGQRRFERAWIGCMQSKGYAVTPAVERTEGRTARTP
jgi:hypothetical protein